MKMLYISGPMSSIGAPTYNFPAFDEAARQLRAAGYAVLSPADTGIVDGWTWADYLRHDLVMLARCDGVATLDGWTRSRGARLEVHVADELDMQTAPVLEWVWAAGQ